MDQETVFNAKGCIADLSSAQRQSTVSSVVSLEANNKQQKAGADRRFLSSKAHGRPRFPLPGSLESIIVYILLTLYVDAFTITLTVLTTDLL